MDQAETAFLFKYKTQTSPPILLPEKINEYLAQICVNFMLIMGLMQCLIIKQ
jgi:hypothetical protein